MTTFDGGALNDRFHEECAVVGVINHPESAKYCYLALYALQHRGQEGAGIVSSDGEHMFAYRDTGLVADVFSAETLESLEGTSSIGHTRYATCGSKDWQNLQPFVANFGARSFSIAHNGNLINAYEMRHSLEASGAVFSSTSDTEVILHLIARAGHTDILPEKVAWAVSQVQGAYSLVIMGLDSLVAVRDPFGVRPLSLGRLGEGYVVASETCAFDLLGATFVRDLKPGEILEINRDGSLGRQIFLPSTEKALCVFEYVYFARPDSMIEGRQAYEVRKRMGAELAREHPCEVDVVIPVPDSGVPAALGYAAEIGRPYEFGLIRNHYVGRTFIEPQQSIRDFGVKVKLNANAEILRGKRVAVIDDSIVRGTTCRKLVAMLRQSGAKEVHFRVSSPPTVSSCFYGIDTPSRDELVAAKYSNEEIRNYIGAESLGYLSLEGMYRAVGAPRNEFCDACFSRDYRLGVPMTSQGAEEVLVKLEHKNQGKRDHGPRRAG